MRRTEPLLILATALGAFAACAGTGYYDVQERWTRDEKAYEGFEAKALVAAHAWNMHIALLEDRGVRAVSALTDVDRPLGERLHATARRLADEALREAPYLLVRYGVLRAIVLSADRSFVMREGGRRDD